MLGSKTSGTHDLACQDTTPEGGVCDDGNAELATNAQDADLGIFDLQIEWRILDLHCCYGVHCMRTSDGCGGDLRETNISDFACPKCNRQHQPP